MESDTMSETRKKSVKTEETPIEPAKLEEMNNVLRDLINANVRLSIKLAKCKCDQKEKCDVYKYASKIADLVDRLQELAES